MNNQKLIQCGVEECTTIIARFKSRPDDAICPVNLKYVSRDESKHPSAALGIYGERCAIHANRNSGQVWIYGREATLIWEGVDRDLAIRVNEIYRRRQKAISTPANFSQI